MKPVMQGLEEEGLALVPDCQGEYQAGLVRKDRVVEGCSLDAFRSHGERSTDMVVTGIVGDGVVA